jgi:hypothetical protein
MTPQPDAAAPGIRSEQVSRSPNGTFAPGHSGNPSGRSKSRQAAADIFDDTLTDDAFRAVVEQAVAMALAGDRVMILALIRLRIPPPREVNMAIELPGLVTPADAVAALRLIAQAVTAGSIAPDQARASVAAVQAFMEITALADLESRLAALEQQPQ